jgi:hypothetical protein
LITKVNVLLVSDVLGNPKPVKSGPDAFTESFTFAEMTPPAPSEMRLAVC